MALPAPGPVAAPDRLSVWPVEGGRYGLDATYHGATGLERAEAQQRNLDRARLQASIRQELSDGWTLRLGLWPMAPSMGRHRSLLRRSGRAAELIQMARSLGYQACRPVARVLRRVMVGAGFEPA